MKLLKKDIDKSGIGFIKLQPEEAEDMWHLYNILTVGDIILASTVRKVHIVTDNWIDLSYPY